MVSPAALHRCPTYWPDATATSAIATTTSTTAATATATTTTTTTTAKTNASRVAPPPQSGGVAADAPRPQLWEAAARGARPSGSYLPFSAGPKGCAGLGPCS